ncbi:hypothetical protein LSH36_264g00045 [Paralvinella palmiformis]|uniref:Uncharacterized protein n=1 Tax=Paralvinella palmiformis TaxID=53620 RepID=A0AAD9JKC1_9ANNE|nr:hypothetical protein LSH36_264g00045 [Paralvinella palmiformis]
MRKYVLFTRRETNYRPVSILPKDDVDVYNYTDDNTFVCSGYDYESVKDKVVRNVNNVITWFETRLFTIREEKLSQKQMLQTLLAPQSTLSLEEGDIELPDDIELPFQTVAALQQLEIKLNEKFTQRVKNPYVETSIARMPQTSTLREPCILHTEFESVLI